MKERYKKVRNEKKGRERERIEESKVEHLLT